VGVAQRAAEL